MSEPEPVNEEPGGAVEVRGGDRPEDYVPAFLRPGDYIVPREAVPPDEADEDAE